MAETFSVHMRGRDYATTVYDTDGDLRKLYDNTVTWKLFVRMQVVGALAIAATNIAEIVSFFPVENVDG